MLLQKQALEQILVFEEPQQLRDTTSLFGGQGVRYKEDGARKQVSFLVLSVRKLTDALRRDQDRVMFQFGTEAFWANQVAALTTGVRRVGTLQLSAARSVGLRVPKSVREVFVSHPRDAILEKTLRSKILLLWPTSTTTTMEARDFRQDQPRSGLRVAIPAEAYSRKSVGLFSYYVTNLDVPVLVGPASLQEEEQSTIIEFNTAKDVL